MTRDKLESAADSISTRVESETRESDVGLTVDEIVETLRNKLESGHGECIYKLVNPCK